MNNELKRWHRKINALLHDPIEKCFDIQNHDAKQENRIKKYLNIEYKKPNSDIIASVVDRIPLPYETSNSKNKRVFVSKDSINLIHPMSAKVMDNIGFKKEIKTDEIIKREDELFKDLRRYILDNGLNINESVSDAKKVYHYLWWNLPKYIEQSYLLPADTRVPDVSIVDHLDTTSAFSNVTTENYSLLMVSIGPVQEFIAAGRKLADLRNGSYLLSYLTYQGIKYIGENYGFDTIIFPSMRDNYFVAKDFNFYNKELDIDPSVASLPNVFTAIVPASSVTSIKEKIRERILLERDSIINYFKEKIENDTLDSLKHNISFEMITEHGLTKDDIVFNFEKQLKQFPNVVITEQELKGFEDLNSEYKSYVGKGLEELKEQFDSLKETYNIKNMQYFGYSSKLLGIKSSIRKATRDFEGFRESYTNPGDAISGNEKALFVEKTRYEDKLSVESISAITLIKRYLPNYLKEKNYIEAFKALTSKDDIKKITEKYNASILIMDGDSMGKWISGEKAPNLSKRLHKDVILRLETLNKEYKNFLESIKYINPSYQRTVSRTLNEFSKLVPKVIKKYDGILIYAGGDDVLAILPSNNLTEAANCLRMVYSGIEIKSIELPKNQTNDKDIYRFENGYMYKNGKLICNMMSEKATMSAGLLTFNPSYNLKLALNEARKLETIAKKNKEACKTTSEEGFNIECREKDSFAISSIRSSGKSKNAVSFWSKNDNDIIYKINLLLNEISKQRNNEKEKSSISFINRIIKEYKELCFDTNGKRILSDEEFINKVIPFVLKRRMKLGSIDKRFSDLLMLYVEDKDSKSNLLDILNVIEELIYTNRERREKN